MADQTSAGFDVVAIYAALTGGQRRIAELYATLEEAGVRVEDLKKAGEAKAVEIYDRLTGERVVVVQEPPVPPPPPEPEPEPAPPPPAEPAPETEPYPPYPPPPPPIVV